MIGDHLTPFATADASCTREGYDIVVSPDLVELLAKRIAGLRLTRATFEAWSQAAPSNLSTLPQTVDAFLRSAFRPWTQETTRLGDVSEDLFAWLRETSVPTLILSRAKEESLSSATPGWDLLEIHSERAVFWAILWEVKGTDTSVVRQTRLACEQLKTRSHEWLVRLSKLLEDKLFDQDPELAGFAAELHRLCYREEEQFHVGVAAASETAACPVEPFNLFHDESPGVPANRHAVFVRIDGYLQLREDVAKWILG